MTRIKGRLHCPPGRINLTARPLALRLFPDPVLRKSARSLGRSDAQGEVLARVLQHEVDHLDGILIIDRASAAQGEPSSRSGG